MNTSSVSNCVLHFVHLLRRMIFPFAVSLVSYTKLSSPQIGHIRAACSVSNIFSPSILLATVLLTLSGTAVIPIPLPRPPPDQQIVASLLSPLPAGPQGFVIDASHALVTHTAHSCLRSTGQPPASASPRISQWCTPYHGCLPPPCPPSRSPRRSGRP